MRIEYTNKAIKQLKKIPKNDSVMIRNKVKEIPSGTQVNNIKKMKGYEQTYRLRVGKYRSFTTKAAW